MSPTSRNRHKKPSVREQARRSMHSTLASRPSNRELKRRANRAIVYGRQAYATLLAVLAQKGGEIVVTQGTIDQVNENYDRLGFVVEPMEGGKEFRVKMTEGREDTPTTGTDRAEETPCNSSGPTDMVSRSDSQAATASESSSANEAGTNG